MTVYSTSTVRLTGIASGMDTESIIQSMMDIEQMKIDREIKDQIGLEWKAEALGTVATDLEEFQSKYFSILGSNSMTTTDAYYSYNVTASGENKGAIEITANSEAQVSSLTINSVTSLAERALQQGANANNTLATDIANHGKDASLSSFTNVEQIFSEGQTATFTINGVFFSFDSSDSLQDVFDEVTNSSADVNMRFDSLSKRVIIESKDTGAAEKVSITNLAGNFFSELDEEGEVVQGFFDIAEGTEFGADAYFMVNGTTVNNASNTITADGITYKLLETFEASSGAVRFNIEKDIEPAVDSITEFVNGYNTMITKLQGLIDEEASSAYEPLTDDEKLALTETQIKQFEDLAKVGLLEKDDDIERVLSAMRSAFYDEIESLGMSASSIGLSTSTDWTKGGIIELDETKLRAALEEDTEAVMNVFINLPEEDGDYSQTGLVYRIDNILSNYVDNTQAATLSTMDQNLTDLIERIAEMEEDMYELEERYYAQFAAMETAMAELNNQTSSLTSLLG